MARLSPTDDRVTEPDSHPVAGELAGQSTQQALLMLALLIGLGFLARGKLGVFPLRSADLAVSQHLFVNSIVANAMQALYMARSERKQSNLGRDPLAGLASYGFAQLQDAMAILAQDARTKPFES